MVTTEEVKESVSGGSRRKMGGRCSKICTVSQSSDTLKHGVKVTDFTESFGSHPQWRRCF